MTKREPGDDSAKLKINYCAPLKRQERLDTAAWLIPSFVIISLVLWLRGAGELVLFLVVGLTFLFSVVAAVLAYQPHMLEERIQATSNDLLIKLPLRRTQIIPWKQISKLEGIVRGAGEFGDDVDIKIYWPKGTVTIRENTLIESRLLTCFRKLPGFDSAAYSAAVNCSPRWFEALRGKRFVLLHR